MAKSIWFPLRKELPFGFSAIRYINPVSIMLIQTTLTFFYECKWVNHSAFLKRELSENTQTVVIFFFIATGINAFEIFDCFAQDTAFKIQDCRQENKNIIYLHFTLFSIPTIIIVKFLIKFRQKVILCVRGQM